MQYRPEVDGLRAVAVVPVVLFHAGTPGFSGGYVGVDVFFVISGYLITSIILAETRAGRFSLASFYERRARRILPALFVVLAACLIPAYLWLLPLELRNFTSSLGWTLMFSSNIFFYRRGGYFREDSEMVPLLHTWSLAVEEQFYLLYPLLLAGLLTRCRSRVAIVMGALIAASLLAAVLGGNFSLSPAAMRWPLVINNTPGWGFYLLPARAWELLIGASVALWEDRGRSKAVRPASLLSTTAAAAGLVCIGFAIVAFGKATPFPSLYTLVPTLGAALVLLFARGGTPVGDLLGHRGLVGIGLISYSFYLWHQPLFAFARHRSLNELQQWHYFILIGLALALAYLTWRLVERPCRDRRRVPLARLAPGLLAAAMLGGGVSLAGYVTSGFPGRMPPEVVELANVRDFETLLQKSCNMVGQKAACVHGKGQVSVALVGDSHAGVIVRELGAALEHKGIAVADYHVNGCPPVRGYERGAVFACESVDRVLDEVERTQTLATVVIVARWPIWFEGRSFDNGEGGREPDATGRFGSMKDGTARAAGMATGIRDVVARMVARGKSVVLVGPVPEVGWDVRPRMARLALLGQLQDDISTPFTVYKERNASALAALAAIPAHPRLVRVDAAALFCDTALKGRCVASKGTVPLYFDRDHLDAEGARMLSERIVAEIGMVR